MRAARALDTPSIAASALSRKRHRLRRGAAVLVAAGTAWLALGTPALAAPGGRSTVQSWFNSLSCPTPKECVAVGATQRTTTASNGAVESGSTTPVAYRSLDGGISWSPAALPPLANVSLTGVACTAALHCVAVGAGQAVVDGRWSATGAVALVGSGGASWRPAALPAATPALLSVACPSAGTCVAVGGHLGRAGAHLLPAAVVSRDGGARWAPAKLPPLSGQLQSVACPSASQCVAVGASLEVVGGASVSRAVALGSSDGGAAWHATRIAAAASAAFGHSGGPDALACVSAQRCVGVGDDFDWCECGTGMPGPYGEVWTTDDGGASWTSAPLPAVGGLELWYVTALSCWSPAGCAFAGSGTPPGRPRGSLQYSPVLAEGSAAGGWAAAAGKRAPASQWIYGLRCWAPTSCVAVGQTQAGQLAGEVDRGGVWAASRL